MMKTASKELGAMLALALGGSTIANGAILSDNLSADQYSASPVPNGWVASSFSTGSNCLAGCTLGNITLNMSGGGTFGDKTTGIKLDIFTDGTGGTKPGTWFGGMVTPSRFGTDFEDTVFAPQATITLANNTTYWVRLIGDDDAETALWSYQFGGSNNWAFDNLGGTSFEGTSDPFMMKVEAIASSPVPIPSAVWLMASGLVALGVRSRKVT